MNGVLKFLNKDSVNWAKTINDIVRQEPNSCIYKKHLNNLMFPPIIFNFTESHQLHNSNEKFFRVIENVDELNEEDSIERITFDLIKRGNAIQFSLLSQGINNNFVLDLWNLILHCLNKDFDKNEPKQ